MSTPSATAFELLHPGIRRQLWDMKWPSLRPLQVDAIQHLMTTNAGHTILTAGTAAGKTEAAFLPILSRIADEPPGSVRAIYVGPLKALINDQFARLEQLCERIDVNVHRWHGDVPVAAKARLIKEPGGVLLITPESLESLFINRSHALLRLFGGLRFAVIDELHAFLDNERGSHLRSLLHRVVALCERPARIVGLSATIGDPGVAQAFIDPDAPNGVTLIPGDAAETQLRMKIHTFVDRRPRVDAPGAIDEPELDEDGNIPAAEHERQMVGAILLHCRGKVNLVFANSRNEVEQFGNDCAEAATRDGLPDVFLVHHGSLSAEVRRDAELTLKAASAGVTAFCTSTLEMGIDIGGVEQVGQIGAPFGVASLKQRVGRSGRREGAARVLRMYLQSRAPDERASLFKRLQISLVQAIAITELMLEGWVEPAALRSCDLSTLTQQILSMIAERGVARADQLFGQLCLRGAFRDVDVRLFQALLRQLGAKDVIEQDGKGELIMGLTGEAIRKDKSFYAAFPTEDQWAVLHAGERIGGIDDCPRKGDHLVLARRRWRVTDLDVNAQAIYVVPSRGRKGAVFRSGGGDLHDTVVRRMRAVLSTDRSYVFLDGEGQLLLDAARQAAAQAGVCDSGLVQTGPRSVALLTWAGGRIHRTMQAMLATAGLEAVNERVGFAIDRPAEEVKAALAQLTMSVPTPERIAESFSGEPDGKYDPLLGPALRRQIIVRREMAVEEARSRLLAIAAAASG